MMISHSTPSNMLNKKVRLKEDYAGYAEGFTGFCTEDVQGYHLNGDDTFAVRYTEIRDGKYYGSWPTFRGVNVRSKFEFVEEQDELKE